MRDSTKAEQFHDVGANDRTWLYVGGGLAVTFLFLGYYLTGTVQEGEAQARLAAAIPTIRFLASGIIAASATILALMLTLLGLTHSHEAMFSDLHYRRVRVLSAMNVAALVGAVFLLMLLSMPVTDSERLRGFYAVAYYVIVGASAGVGGLVIAIALMLHRAVAGLVMLLAPEGRARAEAREGRPAPEREK